MAEARPADQDGDYAAPPREEAPPQRYGRDYGYAPPPPPPAAPFRFGWGRW